MRAVTRASGGADALSLRSYEGLGGAPGLRPEFDLEIPFRRRFDAPREWLACKLGAPSGGGLIA